MNSPNKRAVFTEKAEAALDGIIKIYGLEESEEQAEKIMEEEGKEFSQTILIKGTRAFAQNSISEKDLILSLQKDLAIPQEKSEKLVQEIKLKVVPFLETMTEQPERTPQASEDILAPLIENGAKNIKDDIAPVPKSVPIPSAKNPVTAPQPKKPAKQDAYNEPIQ